MKAWTKGVPATFQQPVFCSPPRLSRWRDTLPAQEDFRGLRIWDKGWFTRATKLRSTAHRSSRISSKRISLLLQTRPAGQDSVTRPMQSGCENIVLPNCRGVKKSPPTFEEISTIFFERKETSRFCLRNFFGGREGLKLFSFRYFCV